MDRTPEGPQAEKPSDEIPISEIPISTTESPSGDLPTQDPPDPRHLPSLEDTLSAQPNGLNSDSPTADRCSTDTCSTDTCSTDTCSADEPAAAAITNRLESDGPEPTRTVIFHRFHPKASGPRRPHFEPEAEATAEDAPGSASDETLSDRFVFGASPPVVSPQNTSPQPVSLGDSSLGDSAYQECSAPQESCADITDIDASDIVVSPEPELRWVATKHRQHARRSDPVRHGVVMLVTVLVMLAAARYILPGLVEEIRYAQHRGQLRAEFEVAGEGLKNVSLDTLSQAYQMVNAAAGPSVVHIDIHRTAHEAIAHQDVPGAPAILISDQGSGVVVDADGYILTNRHVVAGSDQISVTLSDGRTVEAMIVGTDELTDLAVLKVNADRLMPIPWGDSERIRVGSPVWAIGSPFGLDRTVTFGILSGKHRVVRAKDR